MNTARECLAVAQRKHDQYVNFLQQVLRIPTPRMQEHRCIELLQKAFDDSGLTLIRFEGLGLGEPLPDGTPWNLFGTRPGGGGGRSLMIESHLDTVPPGYESKWTVPPWSGEIRDGRIYARGAHDDRVGCAMLWMLDDLLRECGIHLAGDLYYLVTTEEEYAGGGMRAFVQHPAKVVPDAHIGLDGNGLNKCIVGHLGILLFEVVIEGPWGSVLLADTRIERNPIIWAGRLLATLPDFQATTYHRWKDRNPAPRWPAPILVANGIHSRDWVSNVPEECVLRIFANVAPPVTIGEFKTWIEDWLRNFAAGKPWLEQHPPKIRWLPLQGPAYELDPESEFLTLLKDCHQTAYEAPLQTRYIGGWGDMSLLGSPNMLLYGPGGGGGDHQYDEYFELADLPRTLATLAHLAIRWCGVIQHVGSSILKEPGE